MVQVCLETHQETDVSFLSKSKGDCFSILKEDSVSPFKQQVEKVGLNFGVMFNKMCLSSNCRLCCTHTERDQE